MAICAALACTGCAAQDRGPAPPQGAYPYAAGVLAAPKSVRVDGGVPRKNLNEHLGEPALPTIAPDGPSPMALSERRTPIDQMLQSHEFTFGMKSAAPGFTSRGAPPTPGFDLDAIKLRVSRDRFVVRAEWSFN